MTLMITCSALALLIGVTAMVSLRRQLKPQKIRRVRAYDTPSKFSYD